MTLSEKEKVEGEAVVPETPVTKPADQGEQKGGREALRGKVDGREVTITPSGQMLIENTRVSGFPGMENALGVTDDERSGQQVDTTIRMIGKVMEMMVWADPGLIKKLRSGESSLEDVLDRAGEILDKMAQAQLTYEEHRLRVGQLDTAQAALESVSALARSTSILDWMKAPPEIKEIAKLVLDDARRANAIVLAASVDPEKMTLGLANYNKMVDAAARAALEQQLVAHRAQNERAKLLEASHHDAEVKRLEREEAAATAKRAGREAAAELAANMLSRAGRGAIDLADHGAATAIDRADDMTEKIANRFIGEEGILPTVVEGVAAAIAKGKEPHVIGFFAGGVLGLVEGTILMGALTVGGPITWVPLAVVIGSGITGGALGAKTPELFSWLHGRLMGTKWGRALGLGGGSAPRSDRPATVTVPSRPAPPPERPASPSVLPVRPAVGNGSPPRPTIQRAITGEE